MSARRGKMLLRAPADQAAWERRVARDYRDGVALSEIDQRHGCDCRTAHAIAGRHGLAIRETPAGSRASAEKRRARRQQQESQALPSA